MDKAIFEKDGFMFIIFYEKPKGYPFVNFKIYENEYESVEHFYLRESELYMSGYVKFDGCSNWNFDENVQVAYHACDRRGLFLISEIMAFCWDIAKNTLENFDG